MNLIADRRHVELELFLINYSRGKKKGKAILVTGHEGP
jgi:hypothetical protein